MRPEHGARGLGRAWVAPQDAHASFFGLDSADFDRKIQPGYKYVRIMERDYVGMPGYAIYFQNLRTVNRYQKDWHDAARSQEGWSRSRYVTGDRLSLPKPDYASALALALSFPPEIDSAMLIGRVLEHYSYH